MESCGNLGYFDAVAHPLSQDHQVSAGLCYLLALCFTYAAIARPAGVPACTLVTMCLIRTYIINRPAA